MYILVTDKSTVAEIIQEEDPIFPGVPLEKRYSKDFISKLIHLQSDVKVEQNWIYNTETGICSKPKVEINDSSIQE